MRSAERQLMAQLEVTHIIDELAAVLESDDEEDVEEVGIYYFGL